MPDNNSSHPEPLGDLIARAYPVIRRMAAAQARAGTGPPSSLANEVICRVLRLPEAPKNEEHLQGVAWQLMGWIIKDRARSDAARKQREAQAIAPDTGPNALDATAGRAAEAIQALRAHAPRKAEALLLTAVGGLSIEQTASLLGVSTKTIQRDVAFAKAWLAAHLQGEQGASATGPVTQRGGEA